MDGQKPRLRGQSQPIWILIGLLLAMIVGIMMYQVLSGGFSKLPRLENIDSDTAKMGLDSQCGAWKRSSWAIPPTDPSALADYAAKLNLLSTNEWENNERFSSCDCGIYLFVNKLISRSELLEVYDSDYCHDWANEQADNLGISD